MGPEQVLAAAVAVAVVLQALAVAVVVLQALAAAVVLEVREVVARERVVVAQVQALLVW